MITVDGYSSLYRFHSDAEFVIRKKLLTVSSEQLYSNDMTWSERSENIRVAAKYLVRDIFRIGRNESKLFPKIMARDGKLFDASPLLLDFPEMLDPDADLFSKARQKARENGLELKGEYVFGLASLSTDYWHESFNSERFFYDGPFTVGEVVLPYGRVIPLVDWKTGTVCTSKLRHFNEAMEAMRTANTLLRKCGNLVGLDEIDELVRLYEESDSKSLLEMLSAYDGCTVVAPTEWLKFLNLSDEDDREAQNVQRADGAPWEAIISLLEVEPSLTKTKVKARLFPKTSVRRFNAFWLQASELKPEIMKPGRRSGKS